MSALPGWWLLPLAFLLGGACASFSCIYVTHIHEGRPLNAATFWTVIKHTLKAPRQEGRKAKTPLARIQGVTVLTWFFTIVLVIATVPFATQPSWVHLATVAAVAWLAILAVIDARTGYLPDALTLPLLWLGLALAWFHLRVDLHDAVAAAALGYLFLLFTDFIFRCARGHHGVGGGDMKLMAALGAWLGCAALPGLLLAACVLGIAFSLGRHGMHAWRQSMAFGPFLSLAGGIGLLAEPVVQFLF